MEDASLYGPSYSAGVDDEYGDDEQNTTTHNVNQQLKKRACRGSARRHEELYREFRVLLDEPYISSKGVTYPTKLCVCIHCEAAGNPLLKRIHKIPRDCQTHLKSCRHYLAACQAENRPADYYDHNNTAAAAGQQEKKQSPSRFKKLKTEASPMLSHERLYGMLLTLQEENRELRWKQGRLEDELKTNTLQHTIKEKEWNDRFEAIEKKLAADEGDDNKVAALPRMPTLGGTWIHFHNNLAFGSPDDMIQFCKDEHITACCATADAFLLMNHHRAKTLLLASEMDQRFVHSFQVSLPSTLVPSSTEETGSLSSLQALKTRIRDYTTWVGEEDNDDDSDDGFSSSTTIPGVKSDIEKSIAAWKHQMEQNTSRPMMSAVGQQFCTRLVYDSERFVTSFLTFITRFYKKQVKVGSMQEATLWDTCLEMIAHMMDEIVTVRNAYGGGAENTLGLYYWGMVQAWQIQHRYLNHKFINDPALNGIFVRRAFLRKDDHVSRLEKEVGALAGKVESLIEDRNKQAI